MLLGDLADTIANLITFAFIGAMIWLLARKTRAGGTAEPEAEDDKRRG
ncbi:MAG: hypothetical protein AAF684_04005 [Pseudomonadota bacterium]